MNLPLVNVFESPYEVWEEKKLTYEEALEYATKTGNVCTSIKTRVIKSVNNALDAATYMANIGADNRLEHFIDDCLKDKCFRQMMPSKTPKALADYQKSFPKYNAMEVDAEINNIGCKLTDGQFLFHGGVWLGGNSNQFVTQKPFSTSFCPQIALRNAEHKGKAYDSNRIDLLVLRVVNSRTNVFSFRINGTNLGHEKEVLFASGAKLIKSSETFIRNCTAFKFENSRELKKDISVYVV